jgi:hypothetical protein
MCHISYGHVQCSNLLLEFVQCLDIQTEYIQ